MITIPLAEFSRLLTSSQGARASLLARIVRRETDPGEEDDLPPYYSAARGFIKKYVGGKASRGDVAARSKELRAKAAKAALPAMHRMRSNADMIDRFAATFDLDGIQPAEPEAFELKVGDQVVVRLVPDLAITRHGRDQFLKLCFSKKPPPPRDRRARKAMTHVMFEAMRVSRPFIASRDVQLYDVMQAETIICMRADDELKVKMRSLAREIDAAVRARREAPSRRDNGERDERT